MADELMVRQSMALTFDEMTRAAKAMAMSGYFNDARDVSQAMVKVMAGAELGIGAFSSMTGISIIKGKPVLGANLIATLIKQDPRYDYRVKAMDDEGCIIVFYENGEEVGESSFLKADAQKAGLNGDNWKKFPRNMYFARAISNGAKWYTPGVFAGAPVYTADELGADVDAEGDPIIDVTPPARQIDEDTGEIVEAETAEWEDIKPATSSAANTGYEAVSNANDERGDAAPAAQEKRAAQRPARNNSAVDWEAKTLAATNLSAFCAAAAMLLDEYDHANHVKAALEGQTDFEYDKANNAELVRWLRERKAQPA